MKYLLIMFTLFAYPISAVEQVTLNGHNYKEFATDDDKLVADDLFSQKKFEEAMDLYLKLAKTGDKYSQYQISSMYLNGHGVKASKADAYAWAYTAKENKSSALIKHFSGIDESLSKEEKLLAQQKKEQVFSQYGNLAIALSLKKWVYRSTPKCTGSRIRGSTVGCALTYVACGIGGTRGEDQGLKDRCIKRLRYTSPQHLASLQKSKKSLNKIIDDNRGKVIAVQQGNK